MNLFKKWAEQKHTSGQFLLGLIPAGILFLFLIPYLLVKPIPRLDVLMHLPGLNFGVVNLVAGIILIAAGLSCAWWTIYWQMARASGTPLPMLPTQKLLTDGPFQLCRNPMILGTVTAYLGVGILAGSIASAAAVILFGILLLVYVKLVEEKELAARFGQAYLDYKAATPFIFPRIYKHRRRFDQK